MTLDELQNRFDLPGAVRIEEGRGSLPKLTVTGGLSAAELYLHGAHLTHFQPRGTRPLLFMSAESHFDPAKPIRGGVPVIFPWFGPRAGFPDSPAHGFARIRAWALESVESRTDGSVRVVLGLASDESSLRLWPHPFALRMAFTFGRALELDLEVRATDVPLSFEEAFHTYFLAGDVRQVGIEGLGSVDYLDKVDSFRRKTQPAEPVRIVGETDRVYLKTRAACVLRDPVLGRTITVEKENSATTVVWNPWVDKARAMPDFGDDEWPGMICIETANVGEDSVRLGAGESHHLRARIRIAE